MTSTEHKRIGGYEILEPLERSGLSRVFKARCVVGNRPNVAKDQLVALKVLPSVADGSDACVRIERHARHLLTVTDKRVVRFLDAFKSRIREAASETGDEAKPARAGGSNVVPCLVMELLEGYSLATRVNGRGRGLPREKVADVFTQCLDGLILAREKGVLPRYLDPSNIFLAQDGGVKLVGFSLPHLGDNGSASVAGGRAFFDYVAPDFVRSETYGDQVSIVFSLGVCFYQALTGLLPFPRLRDQTENGNCFNSLAAAYRNRWQGANGIHPTLSEAVFTDCPRTRAFLEKCLQPKRESRFDSFEAMRAELAGVVQELAHASLSAGLIPPAKPDPEARPRQPIAVTRSPAPPATPPRPGNRRLPWLVAAAVCALLLLAWFVSAFLKSPPAEPVEATAGPEKTAQAPAAEEPALESVPEPTTTPPETGTAQAAVEEKVSAPAHETAPAVTQPVAVRVHVEPPNPDEPPVQVARRDPSGEGWQPVGEEERLATGRHEFQFTRADHRPFRVEVDITPGAPIIVVEGPRPEDWEPGEVLQALLRVEQALEENDTETLSRSFASIGDNPGLAWPGHTRRLEQARTRWLKAQQRQNAPPPDTPAMLMVLVESPETDGESVQMEYRPTAETEWQPCTETLQVMPGPYYLRFQCPDYEALLRLVRVPAGKERLRVRGPRQADWKPTRHLQELLDLETALDRGDMEWLTKRFARPLNLTFGSAEHGERLERVRDEWYQKLVAN